MVATGNDDQLRAIHPVDETIGFIDATRPEAREAFLQGFGLANTVEWTVSIRLLNVSSDIKTASGASRRAITV